MTCVVCGKPLELLDARSVVTAPLEVGAFPKLSLVGSAHRDCAEDYRRRGDAAVAARAVA